MVKKYSPRTGHAVDVRTDLPFLFHRVKQQYVIVEPVPFRRVSHIVFAGFSFNGILEDAVVDSTGKDEAVLCVRTCSSGQTAFFPVLLIGNV